MNVKKTLWTVVLVYAIVLLVAVLWLLFNEEGSWVQAVLFWSLFALGDAVHETRKLVKDTSLNTKMKACKASLKMLGWVTILAVICYGVDRFIGYIYDHLIWVW